MISDRKVPISDNFFFHKRSRSTMVVRDFTWVVLSTCFLLLVLDRQTASFRLGDRIKDYSGLSLEEKINSSLNAAVIPSYLQELLKVSENGTFEGEDFLEKLLDGVTSDSCKAHVTKWFDIMGPNSLKKENTWAWQSKKKEATN